MKERKTVTETNERFWAPTKDKRQRKETKIRDKEKGTLRDWAGGGGGVAGRSCRQVKGRQRQDKIKD